MIYVAGSWWRGVLLLLLLLLFVCLFVVVWGDRVNFYKIQTQKGSNERLFILTRTHIMHIFGEIFFVKPQNDT